MRAWLRRPPSRPGADDARALAAANRHIVRLETTVTSLQHRLDRLAGQCAPPCPHELRQADLEFQALCLTAERDELTERMRAAVARLYELTDPEALADGTETAR